MSVGIGSVQHSQAVQFKQEMTKSKLEKNSLKSSTKVKKVMIGAGLTALAAVGIYLATKGKKANFKGMIDNIVKKTATKSAPQNAASVNSGISVDYREASKSLKEIKDLKFENGVAKYLDGTNYTGQIKLKDNKYTRLFYRDGKLKEANCTKFSKSYDYNKDGKLERVITFNGDGWYKNETTFSYTPEIHGGKVNGYKSRSAGKSVTAGNLANPGKSYPNNAYLVVDYSKSAGGVHKNRTIEYELRAGLKKTPVKSE